MALVHLRKSSTLYDSEFFTDVRTLHAAYSEEANAVYVLATVLESALSFTKFSLAKDGLAGLGND